MNFGQNLRAILAEKGIKHTYVADKLGMSRQQFHRVSKDKDVKLSLAVKIADALDITVYDLAGR
jgi:DNA-binding Xre family transcriptional regulator